MFLTTTYSTIHCLKVETLYVPQQLEKTFMDGYILQLTKFQKTQARFRVFVFGSLWYIFLPIVAKKKVENILDST